MKKYGMIFASVIFTLVIMLIPNQKVNAATYSFNLSSKYNSMSTYSEINAVYSVIDFLKSIEDDYYVVFTLNTYNYYYNVFIAEKNDVLVTNNVYHYSDRSSRILLYLSSSTNVINKSIANINLSSSYTSFEMAFNNNEFTTGDRYDLTQPNTAQLLYSNVDFLVSLGSSSEIIYNDNNLIDGDIFPSYYDWYLEKNSSIVISSNFANDLDGNAMEVVTIDFANVYDENYIYQYKTSFSEWIDISDYVNESSSYGYYYYRFNLYYNTIIETRVLDSENNVLFTSTKNITSLSDYDSTYVYRNNFSSSTHSDLKYITFQSNYNELNVSHKFRLQYLSNDKSLTNIPDFISYEAYLVDVNGVILNYDFDDYFTISYNEYKLYDEDYETYLDGVITQIKELPGYAYGFKIVFEFDNLNNYTINVFDNYSKSTTWDYIMNFLDGYTRIKFPVNYDTAIIRSKDYTNLSSSLIYMNVLFTSLEYGLNFYNYDFINKRQNYSYITSDVTVDYSMITFDVNESNNVFPVLFRNSDSDEVFIYLKDDCFIQFVNRETLESYIVGTDEDDFNENNDLVIDDEFNNFIDDNFNFDNASFYEMFSDGFENFRNVIVEIFQNVNYFFQGLCIDLKYFYIVVFAFVLIIFLTRFLL